MKNFALSLVLKQSFDNSKEADPCGPFIRSIELKTEFFFDVRDDVIDEILEVESFNYVSKSRKLGNNETFLLLCLQKDILQAKHIKNCSESSLFIFILVIFFIFLCVCQLVMSTIYTLAVFCEAIKMIQLCSDLYREYKYMNICQTRWKLWLVIIIIMELNPLILRKSQSRILTKIPKYCTEDVK